MENLIENLDSRFFGSGVDFYERVYQRWERLGDSDSGLNCGGLVLSRDASQSKFELAQPRKFSINSGA